MKTFSKKPSSQEILSDVNCPVCGGSNPVDWWDCSGYSFRKCPVCQLIYQTPQPDFSSLQLRYDDEYFQYEIRNEKIFFQLMMLGLKDVRFFDYRPLEEKGAILDIGCATGRLLHHFRKNGWKTAGAEICTESAEYGNRHYNVNIFNGPMEEGPFQAATMDVIHCSHLIEHLQDPRAFVKNIFRLLKPGGYFLCTTPSAAGLQAKLFKSGWRSAIADHLFLFSPKNLRALLESEFFQILGMKTWGGLAVGAGPRWIKKILDPLSKKLGFGDVMIFLAQKPD